MYDASGPEDGAALPIGRRFNPGQTPMTTYSTVRTAFNPGNNDSGTVDENGTFILSGKVSFNGDARMSRILDSFFPSSSFLGRHSKHHRIRRQGSHDGFRTPLLRKVSVRSTRYFRGMVQGTQLAAMELSGRLRSQQMPEPSQSWWGEANRDAGGWYQPPRSALHSFITNRAGHYHYPARLVITLHLTSQGWNPAYGMRLRAGCGRKTACWPYLSSRTTSVGLARRYHKQSTIATDF